MAQDSKSGFRKINQDVELQNTRDLIVGGDVTANAFIGDGSQLTGISTAAANDALITLTAGGGLTGGGGFTVDQASDEIITISHSDTSSQASVNNDGLTVIQDITLDTYGHITAIGSTDISTAGIYVKTTDEVGTGIKIGLGGTTYQTLQFFANNGISVVRNDNEIVISAPNYANWNSAYSYSQVGHLPLTGGTLSGPVVVNIGNVTSDTVAFKVGGPGNYDSLTMGIEDSPDYDSFIASYGNDIRFYSGKDVGTENHSFYWFTSKAGTSQHNQVAMLLDHNQNLSVTSHVYVSGGNSTQWNTAYGWGNHANAGYLSTTGKAADSNLLDGIDSTGFVRAYSTTDDNIDSDWGQSFKTFDPIPSGTPPIASPNIRTINVGENYARRTQLAFNYSSDQAWFRRKTNETWYDWREFIHSGNIGSQSVNYATTAGTASSANSVAWSNISSIPSLWYQSGSWLADFGSYSFVRENGVAMTGGSEFVLLSKSGQGHVLIDGSYWAGEQGGFYSLNTSNQYTSQVGFNRDGNAFASFNTTVIAANDMRAPIFYDSNNTGYYVNPDGTSSLAGLTVANTISGSVSGSAGSVAWGNVSSKPAGWLNATNLVDSYAPSSTAFPSGFYENYNGSGNPTGTWFNYINVRHSNPSNGHGYQAGMSYYDNNFWFRSYQGGTSPTFQSWEYAIGSGGTNQTKSGYLQSNSSLRAPIFYDSNNTGYYLDPTSTTSIRTVGSWRADSSDWDGEFSGKIQYHSTNWYLQAAGYFLFRNSAGVNVFQVDASGNTNTSGYIRINANTNLYLDNNYGQSIVGVYSSYRYQGIFAMGDSYKLPIDGTGPGNLYGLAWSHPNAGGVASNLVTHGLLVLDNGTFLAAVSASIIARDDMRAPRFYDSNNTNYYIDPNSISVLNEIVDELGNRYTSRRHSGSDFPNGTLVQTNIPATAWAGDSFVLEATGKSYSGAPSFSFMAEGYLYADTIINYSGIHFSLPGFSQMKIFEYNGYLCFWWPRYSYWNSFDVLVRSANGSSVNRVTSITDSTEPTGTKKVTVTMAQSAVYDANWSAGRALYAGAYYDSNHTGYYLDPNGTSNLSNIHADGYLHISRSNTTGNGIILADDGDIVDLNDAYCSMRFSYGVRVFSANRGGSPVHTLHSNGTFTASGDVVAYSDERVKENITKIDNALELVSKLEGVYYNRTDKEDKSRKVGVIAQQVQKILPEVVQEQEDGMLGVSYGNITAVLIEAIKEQNQIIEDLKQRIAKLEL